MEGNNKKNSSAFDEDDNNDLDLNYILNIILRNKNTVLITSFIGTLLGIVYCSIQQPVYMGRFQVIVDSNGEESNIGLKDTSIRNLLTGSSISSLKSEELILKSPFVLKPVYEYALTKYALRNDMKQNWSFNKWSSQTLDINFRVGTNILDIGFKDKDKKFILSTLDKIITEYQNYSKLSRDKELRKGFNFLTRQQNILKEKSLNSTKELNKFAIENGLGDIDGFVSLGPRRKLQTNLNLGLEDLMNNNNSINFNSNSTNYDKAGQRFENQFKLLEEYEAEYIDYSSILKPNSELLKNLKLKIDNFKEALKRPNEILLKYKELSTIADRDEKILNQIEDDLAFTKLEIAKQKDPWEMIFEPTIDDYRISPKKTETTIIAFLSSFIFSILLAFLKEKSTGKIFELNDLKKLIKCELIECIDTNNKKFSKELVFKFVESKTGVNPKINLTEISFINTFSDEDNNSKNFARILFENEQIELIELNDTNKVNYAKYLIIFINKNNIKRKDINLINKYISLYPSKVLGWYFLEDE